MTNHIDIMSKLKTSFFKNAIRKIKRAKQRLK